MKYSDFIHVNEGFQTSVNLEYDLNKPEKVQGTWCFILHVSWGGDSQG